MRNVLKPAGGLSGPSSLVFLGVTYLVMNTVTGAPFGIELANGSFEQGMDGRASPVGWSLYAGGGNPQRLSVVDRVGGGKALLLEDRDPNAEIGIYQEIEIKPGLAYEVSVDIAACDGHPAPWNVYLQMRFLPSNEYVQTGLETDNTAFAAQRVTGTAPDDTKRLRIYLYTHRGQSTRILIDNVQLRGGVPPPKKQAKAPPMKAPVYSTLKDLCVETPLVAEGEPRAVLVAASGTADHAAALKVQAAVREQTGAALPVVDPGAAAAALPFTGHVVVFGNRSTNALLSRLYDRYYTLLDLKYPGPGGYVVRTLHNPFGNGLNAVLAGGSDDIGIEKAGAVLAAKIAGAAAAKGNLSLGWIMDIRLGKGVVPPTDIGAFETWEASDGYGSVGYFGWNSLSKRMAMYYMTGDQTHAREFLRLAFPDANAIRDIETVDGERIENKDDPLAGAYHYNQHMMILYWDLIEESPVFSDEQRLRITNSLARQLEHDDYARKGVFSLTGPASAVSSRHGQWAAISLYCLGRYFETYYASDLWSHCRQAGEWAFGSLHKHAWVHGESDNLFWYSTGIAPIFTYLTLTGDRVPLENGVLSRLLKGQEILLSGERGDRQLNSASLGFLHKAAYLTNDGRWIYYRQRTRMKTDIFRLGQSYWPPPSLTPEPPTDLLGAWNVQPLPRSMWQRRQSGIPLEASFQFASFRTRPDELGDFLLLDGYNGASRNPYHTFAVLDLRIDGVTLLRGYHNQLLSKADGMVESTVAMDGALLDKTVLGRVAYALGNVPDAAYCDWRRTLCLRTGTYALAVDELTFRKASRNMTVQTSWETRGGTWRPERDAAVLKPAGTTVPDGWAVFKALDAACTSHPEGPRMIGHLGSIGIVLLRATEPGSWLDVPFELDRDLSAEWFLDTVKYVDRGIVRILFDGREVKGDVNLHSEGASNVRIPLGHAALAAGPHTLRLEVTGRAAGVTRCYAAVGALVAKPAGSDNRGEEELVFSLHPSTLTDASGSGIIRVTWNGEVRQNEHKHFFSLLVRQPKSAVGPACLQTGDCAAALRLPGPALAAVTGHPGVTADLLVVAADHLFGRRVSAAGPASELLRPSGPVTLDWDFAAGRMAVEAPTATTVELALEPNAQTTVDGKPVPRSGAGAVLQFTAGRHTVGGVPPARQALSALRVRLENLVEQGLRQRAASRERAESANALPEVAELPTRTLLPPAGGFADMVRVGSEASPFLAVASNTKVRILDAEESVAHELETDGPIRVLHWWAAPELLLAGCADEKLLAIGLDGSVRWTFTSVMDPAVYRAAKTYWFKTAPGHEGIHGLASGAFYQDKQMCFVGSACTLEILDPAGELVERRPVFWGPGKILRLLEQADGSRDLLIARWPNGTDRLAILNSKTAKLRHGFYGVPSGQCLVGGWSAQNRVDVIPEDIDEDGRPEVVSATNGRWNRVTVFRADGRPLHNAQFGPGPGNRFRSFMRDLTTVNLDGNGKKGICAATAEGLLVTLNTNCDLLWSIRFPSPPALVVPCADTVREGAVLVGCDDGTLAVVDAQGTIVRTGKLKGRPAKALRLGTKGTGRLVIATRDGSVHAIENPPR